MRKSFTKKMAALLTGVLALSLAACGGSGSGAQTSSAPSEEKEITLRLASTVASTELESRDSGMSAGLMTWIDTVEQESGGSIHIDLYPDGQLATGTDAIVNGIQTGAFDVSHFVTGSWATYTNAFSELNVPYLYSNYDEVHNILEGEIGQAMMEQLQNDVSGITPLCYISIGFREITSSKPIHSVADMKGLKIRTMDDKLQIATMEAMGATVTSVPISELYSALQTKMVDAQENPLSTIYSQKFYEVNPYCCISNHSYTSTFVFMNSEVYESLSDNQKAAIDKANAAATAASKVAVEKADSEYADKLTEAGMTIYQPTAEEMEEFRKVASTTWSEAEKIMGSERFNKLMQAMGIE